jgi:hypothetical protein
MNRGEQIGPAPVVVGPTTTVATTTVAPTTTLAPTTTTQPANPIPPAVAAAITTACNTFAAAVAPFGVDVSPLVLGCGLVANGQGGFLLQTFLISPSLGCAALAGIPGANNPFVAAGCITFATSLAPFTSIIAGLIPATFP